MRKSSQVRVDPAATAEPLIAADVKADICTDIGRWRGHQTWREGGREEGAERIARVFCCTPVCFKDRRVCRGC